MTLLRTKDMHLITVQHIQQLVDAAIVRDVDTRHLFTAVINTPFKINYSRTAPTRGK